MKTNTIFFVFLFFFNSVSFSQSFKGGIYTIASKESTLENMKFSEEVNIDTKTFFKSHQNLFGLTEYDSMNIYKVNHFEEGHIVYRYNQFYKGVKVWGSEYLLHQNKVGRIFLGNGHVGSQIQLEVTPKLPKNVAIELAIKNSICTSKPWDVNDFRKYTKYPKAELLIYNPSFGTEKILNTYYLAYKVDIYCDHSESIFINALNGQVLGRVPLQYECNATSVNTIFNGSQSINNQKVGSIYKLIDDCQPAKFTIYDMYGSSNQSNASIISNTTNNWTTKIEKEGATSLWALKKTYEYFKNKRNYLSIDNQDRSVDCYINGDIDNNAYMRPNSYEMYLGQPTDINSSFSTLDIVGHEFTHGVTNFTSGLIYFNESGALNESFSDIFGEIIEKDVTGSGDWIMGGQRQSGAIRSFTNPGLYNQPKIYKGINWYKGSYDNGGVHINSGVQNHWFYLLTNGGGSVTGLGFEKSSKIAFNTLKNYLTTSSNYSDARNQSINATIELYGINSNEVCQVINAWYEVGLGDACNLNSCDSCHCAVIISSKNTCSYYYTNLYDNKFDSTVEMPSCNTIKSTKTKDMWYQFIAQDSTETIKVELIGFDPLNKINPSLTLYKGCHKDSILNCFYSYKQGDIQLEMVANGLTIGKTYFIRLMDFHQTGDTVPKSSIIGLCVTHGGGCPKPKNLNVAKTIQNNSYTLSWDDFSTYEIEFDLSYKTLNGIWKNITTSNNTQLSLNYNLLCDSTYLWQVRAQCTNSYSSWSDIDTFIVDTCNFNNKINDLISINNKIFSSNSDLYFSHSLRLTGNPVIPTSLNVSYYLSKSPNGSSRDIDLFKEDISEILTDKYLYLYKSFNLCDYNLPPDTYYLCYILDEENNLKEDNELNNNGIFKDSFYIDCNLVKPNLIVRYPVITLQNNVLEYDINISNNGNKKCESFDASLYLIDPNTQQIIYKLYTERVSNLKIDENYNVDWSINLCKYNIDPNQYKFMFLVDSSHEVDDEYLYDNFDISIEWFDIGCDVDLKEHKSYYSYDNGKVSIGVTVLNSGTTSSPPFKIGFYLSKSPLFSSLDYKIGETLFAPLSSSNTDYVLKTFNVCNLVKTGKYYMGYIIDYDNQIIETNENNNNYFERNSINVICNTNSINQSLNEQEIVLYPNPTCNIVYISNLKEKVPVFVYDLLGKMVKSTVTKESISLEDLSLGTYFIKIEEKVFKVSKTK